MGTLPSAWEADDTLTFDSILGNSAAKRALFEHVVLPLKLSEEARATIFGERFDTRVDHASPSFGVVKY